MDRKEIRDAARLSLEAQLRSADAPWERIPILLALSKEPTRNDAAAGYEYACEALSLARELQDPFWIACGLQMVGLRIAGSRPAEEVLDYLTQASEAFAGLNDLKRKAETDLLAANTCLELGRFVPALSLLLGSLDVFKQLKTPYWLVHTLCSLGDLCTGVANHSKAIVCYRRAVSIALQAGLQTELGILYQHLSRAYRYIGEQERCYKYLVKSLRIHRQNNDKGGTAVALANLANLYFDQGLYPRAEKYTRQSGRLYQALGYVSNEAFAWGRLGLIYGFKEEPAKAVRYFRKGLALAHACRNTFALGVLYEKYGLLLIKMGERERGISYVKRSVRYIKQSNNKFYYYQAYEMLARVFQETGDEKNGLKYYKRFKQLKEAYIDSNKIIETGYAEVNEKIKAVSRKLKIKKATNNNLRAMIEEKEQELVVLTRQLLVQHKPGAKDRSTTVWEIFSRQFHKIHYGFYNRLVEWYPGLTPTEIKVCSLIRIGLSTKEIAELLCIAKRTVDTHRVHIHKKMNLPQGTSLAGFIMGIVDSR